MGKPPHPAFYDGSMERNRGGRPRHPDVLTPAEWRVLEALREGGTNAEIAARLGVSANTVRYHVSNMLAKLELRDRRALAAWRPEGRRRRLGGVLALPAALWSVGRPLAWVGVGAAALAGVAVVVVALVALEVIVEGDPGPPSAVAPPPATPTPTAMPAATATPTATATVAPSPTPMRTPDPTPAAVATPSPGPTPPSEPSAATSQSPAPTAARLPPSPVFDTPPGVYRAIAVSDAQTSRGTTQVFARLRGTEHFPALPEHACALTELGKAVCWTIDDATVWDAPLGPFSFITVVDGVMCATTIAGGIACWAPGGGPVANDVSDPSRDAPSGRYTALSGASGYYCALTEEGEAVCWGEGGSLPLPELPPGPYSAISVGFDFAAQSGNAKTILTACILDAEGSLACWRAIDRDSIDANPDVEQSLEPIPGSHVAAHVYLYETCTVTTGGLANCGDWGGDGSSRYTSLALGEEFVCAITDGGAIECRKHDIQGLYFGEWGASRLMSAPEPGAGHRYAAVSVGYARACALTGAGEATCWGRVDNKVARPDPPLDRYVAVTDGYGHTCALTTDGEAVCWGWNNFGQADPPDGRYTTLSAGFATTCALTEAREPVCWGALTGGIFETLGAFPRNMYRAISTGYVAACALTEEGSPVCIGHWELAEADAPPGPFAAITVGYTGHACALNESGGVACWARQAERHGQLDVPPGAWTAVAAGELQTCGVARNGGLVCWGAWPTRLSGAPAERYVAVDTNGYDTCVLTESGQVLCGAADGLDLRPISGDLRISQISVGLNRICGVTDAGAVVCWGDTEYANPLPFLNRHGYQSRRYP